MSENRRTKRVERELMGVVSQYLVSHFKLPLPGLISVSRVMISPDLRNAKVFFLLLGEYAGEPPKDELDETKKQAIKEETIEEALSIIQSEIPKIQYYVGKELPMKFCPKLKFFYDDGQEQYHKISNILEDLKKTHSPYK